MKPIVGAIFPVSAEQAKRIFDEGRSAFIKYTKFQKLQANDKIVFYVSREKKLAGEAIIAKIMCLSPNAAWSAYENEIFLNEKEFEEYTSISPIGGKARTSSVVTIFLLKEGIKYEPAIPCKINITPSGCYLSKEDYERIRENE